MAPRASTHPEDPEFRISPTLWMAHLHVWKWVALVVVLLIGHLEWIARKAGHVPTVRDDPKLWSHVRTKLAHSRRPPITILGASRSAFGIDTQALADRFPDHFVYQLSVRVSGILPLLENLAASPPPPGKLILSLAGPSLEHVRDLKSEEYVQAWSDEWRLALRWDRHLRSFLQEHFAILHEHLDLRTLAYQLPYCRNCRSPDLIQTTRSRDVIAPIANLRQSVIGPRRQLKVETYQHNRENAALSPEEWTMRLERAMHALDTLSAAGTQTLIVRMPSSGPYREIEDRVYPREKYWRLVEKACAARSCTTIHVDDEPSLQYETADFSHIAREDRAAFTRALIDVAQRRDFWTRKSP